ncbi:MAG TPA: type IX secretion system outer membrane channel protein PorV [Flavobacteriaceae bacterium]|nr:type IX secretion system outer membrane channel protein PorV [Flavobacteriaceae bacterium]
MKKICLFLLLASFSFKIYSQEEQNLSTQTAITTAVPFLLIAADARAAGMGDMGVATSVDAFSQQWNPAKYAFSEYKQGFGVTYTPYLSELVNDIFLGNLTYYNRLNERSAVAASFRYFSLGEIELGLTPEEMENPLIQRPNEFTFDVSYSLRLSERFAMAVAGRYLRSDLKIQAIDADATPGSSFAVDIAGYYQSEVIPYNDFDGRWRLGFNISNIGPKIRYDDLGQENFLPTNLRLGGGFDFILDDYNKVGVTGEVNKLLVPTPPIRDLNTGEVVEGKDDDVNFFSGIFQSFGDAPGGFSEEMKEFTWALGAEYVYQDAFSLRVGYFNESKDKGNRKFASIGAGFRYTTINIDVSYLFSTSKVRSPLEGTLRFGLTFNLGEGEYLEY